VLGGLSVLALAIAAPAARSLPETEPASSPVERGRLPLRPLLALLVGYGFFGAGYIAYMTFIVAVFEGEGATSGQVTAFWVVLGVAAAGSAFVWSRPPSALRPGSGAALVLAILGGRFGRGPHGAGHRCSAARPWWLDRTAVRPPARHRYTAYS
jgi:hypothetical protein